MFYLFVLISLIILFGTVGYCSIIFLLSMFFIDEVEENYLE